MNDELENRKRTRGNSPNGELLSNNHERHRTDDNCHGGSSTDMQDQIQSNPKLSHDQYTVGWVCALPKEMAAATAMLDREHESLGFCRGNSNTYTLGNIGLHNIVIACLPSGQYSTVTDLRPTITLLACYRALLLFSLYKGAS
ncbi:hypothetical protein VM1G_07551 [Cytospora mali]|uniref:Uncharacterized protein n=1 Tax=Cytospora mali TaxID=578113 RepID=A0A194W7C3_CYTMA|nr:hypothetical protein VM1G_07551 [Valsa mali]